jgi:hypothetical protein
LTVRVPPGACKVLRTSAAVNLVGQCSGILPKYVAQFDGQSSNVLLGKINQEAGTNSISFSVWFYTTSLTSNWPMIFGDDNGNPRMGYDLFVAGGSGFPTTLHAERYYTASDGISTSAGTILSNTWYFGVITYDGSTMKLYLNGAFANSHASTNSLTLDSPMSLGAVSGLANYGSYLISNFQIYNTSLDASSVATLYQEGIGGAPVSPQYLVGWWPLNGDTNDYSGNNNNGAPTAITYTAQYGK